MKKLLLLIALIFVAGTGKSLLAQNVKPVTSSDTLVVMWSSGDPEVAEKACLMYTYYAKKRDWFKGVVLFVWGPSEKLLTENKLLQDKLAEIKNEGVTVMASVVAADMYKVTDKLKDMGIDVRPTGIPLTGYLKRGCRLISY